MKLYADEPGHEIVRALDLIVVSCIARVEVPAAIWRKQRARELTEAEASLLTAEFEVDYFGTADQPSRFVVTGIAPSVLDLAARLVATRGLRAYDGIQLASACAARNVDPDCESFVCSDLALRTAAASEGFTVLR